MADRVLPPVLTGALAFDERVVFCVAMDRNGYLPTHCSHFQPQGPDPVWNAANCRNRRIYRDRTVTRACGNRHPFLLQSYRRDLGGGSFAAMKHASAPIMVGDGHWGTLVLAYRPVGPLDPG